MFSLVVFGVGFGCGVGVGFGVHGFGVFSCVLLCDVLGMCVLFCSVL